MSTQVLCPLFNWFVYLLIDLPIAVELYEFLIYFSINSLSDTQFVNISSCSIDYLFTLFPLLWRAFSFNIVPLVLFDFVACDLGDISKKSFSRPITGNIFPLLSSRSFTVSGQVFHAFWVDSVCDVGLISFFLSGCPVFPTPVIEETILTPLCALGGQFHSSWSSLSGH